MPKMILQIRKMDQEISIENKMGLIAIANEHGVVFTERCITRDELDRVNSIAQDIEFHLINSVEE